MTTEVSGELLGMVISAVVTLVLLPMIAKLGKLAAAWVESKTHSAAFACATYKLSVLVGEAVADTEQMLVRQLKNSDKWDAVGMQQAREAAFDSVKRALGPEGLKEVMSCLKVDGSGLSQRIYQMIESVINGSKFRY